MSDDFDEDFEIPEDRPCCRCGKNPAEGLASIWTQETGERWFCHGDDDASCYEAACGSDRPLSEILTSLLDTPPHTP